MIKKIIFISTVLILMFLSSCKTEFEKVRTSGDPELMAKTALKYYEEEKYLQAQSLYEIIIPFYRGKAEASDIFFNYAYTHYYLREYILASYYFKRFSDTYYSDMKREEALYMAAYSNYELSPNSKLDQSYSIEAISGFQLFVNTFPESKRVKKANEMIDGMRVKMEEKAFMEGQLYLDIKQYEAATRSFQNMLLEYPDSDRAEEARYLIIVSSYDLAKNSIYTKQKERYTEVITRIEKFLKKHTRTKYRKELILLKKNSNKKLNQL